ncbi:Cell division protein ftsQ homolog [Bartonella clarridgeiae 73]|uniref:Cell division protein FtsQ n=1 Tax=Bartonella clarridgeiae (strain CCUG 45776 / CIP 104772 / 73) TaxID=696125 RepID=E6YII7_BARC7|nr:MAG: Cell division protein FtsQ [Bartonella clarridgeiae]CBI76675.1 Cell division protein ftsQ homolog [Bartonella clarridgeiae 73]
MYALNVGKMGVLGALKVLLVPIFRRFYRRFLRFMLQFVLVDIHVPRYFGSFAVFSFFLLSLFYGIVSSSHMDKIIRFATSNFGFVITHVDMSGNKNMTEQSILKLLELDAHPSIISFDVDKARSTLEQQMWVQSAYVQKIYPNRIYIAVVEREPYAIWQHDGVMDIIDDTGYIILPFQAGLVQDLPLVVGQGAQNAAKLFIQSLSAYSQFRDRIRAYVRVGDRRWDIFLENGVRIMLPEQGAIERLVALVKTDMVDDLFSRDALSIDLRLSDRITIALSDEVLARHRAMLMEEERILKILKERSI